MTGRLISGAVPARLEVREQSDIGECRRSAKRLAEAFKFDEDGIGKVGIVATELATNVVRHGGGGEMLLQVLDDGIAPQVEMLAIDSGLGMRDVEQCMRDGYSTAGTPGTGLGAVSRLSTLFDIFSAPEHGTVVLSRVARKQDGRSSSALEYGAACLPLAGEIECGDIWRIADDGTLAAVFVADGLGHGPLAATAARRAVEVFGGQPFEEPSEAMQRLHRGLIGGRGAVAALARLHVPEARVEYAGVGNISASVVGRERSQGMVSHNGTLGVSLLRTRQFAYNWPVNNLVIMHSDGLSARWNLADHTGLFNQHPGVIAGVLYRESSRKRDDVTVVVVRHRPNSASGPDSANGQ
jgi:anti-sigma regulatory factor (Ser/Thr protein kinase)